MFESSGNDPRSARTEAKAFSRRLCLVEHRRFPRGKIQLRRPTKPQKDPPATQSLVGWGSRKAGWWKLLLPTVGGQLLSSGLLPVRSNKPGWEAQEIGPNTF